MRFTNGDQLSLDSWEMIEGTSSIVAGQDSLSSFDIQSFDEMTVAKRARPILTSCLDATWCIGFQMSCGIYRL